MESRILIFGLLVSLLCSLGLVLGVNECMSGKELNCFDCDSRKDPRCHDPFNFTDHRSDMPPTRKCDGCCVKLVQHRGSSYETVRRTCTDQIDINLFMVDHVCMTEGGKDGIMCFCEENRCNGSRKTTVLSINTFWIFSVILCILVY